MKGERSTSAIKLLLTTVILGAKVVALVNVGVQAAPASAPLRQHHDSADSDKASKIRGAFFGALVADALCLGSHYEYDAKKIYDAYGGGNLTRFMSPGEYMGGQTHGVGWGERNYHPGAVAGDQTDYGEYNILLLEFYYKQQQERGGEDNTKNKNLQFDLDAFLPMWKDRLMSAEWKQWRDTQTKRALQHYLQGRPKSEFGGPSNAMALRYAAAFGLYDNEDDLVVAARGSMFTHGERTALLGNEFFARLTFRVIHQMIDGKADTPSSSLRSVIESLASKSDPWIQQKVAQAIAKVDEATDPTTDLSKELFVDDLALTSMARLWDVGKSEPIKVGKASPTEGTLPGAIYFILKYQHDFFEAAKANALVGGDNASRSIPIGMVLGAYHGIDAIPRYLLESLNGWKKCQSMMDGLPLLLSSSTSSSSSSSSSNSIEDTESVHEDL